MNCKRVIRSFLLTFILLLLILSLKGSPIIASSSWQTTTQLPYQLASHTSFASGNKIFTINGSADFMSSRFSVLSNNLNQNGSLSSWSDASSETSTALIWHVTTTKEPYVYILGGKEENSGSAMSHVNNVFLGTLNNSKVTSWAPTTRLPQALSLGGSLTAGNKLYYAGGMREQGGNFYNQKVYVADIEESDGTLGAWSEAGNLPIALSGFGMFSHGENIIIVGGENLSGRKNKTYKTTLNPDGTLGPWTETSMLPKSISRAQFAKSGSKIFVIGGINTDGTTSDDVYFTEINTDGSLDPWQTSTSKIPNPTCCGTAVGIGNYIYLMGGHNTNNGEYFDDVYFADADSIAGNDVITLNVPYFSQNSKPWGITEYDHTRSLGANAPTMDRWGCAVTSAAMVLRYYGIDKMANGTSIDPGSLNNWLKNNSGYSSGKNKNGWYSGIKWNHVSKLTKEVFTAGKSNIKLEFDGIYTNNSSTDQVINHDLSHNKIPGILFVSNANTSGHYVVTKGKTVGTYLINDPEWNAPDLSSFNDTYSKLVRYNPSLTDLSFIDLSVNPEIEILLTDSAGRKTGAVFVNGQKQEFNEIPDALYHFESPLSNQGSLGTGFNQLLVSKPENEHFIITLSSNSAVDYEINISSYQTDGSDQNFKIHGILSSKSDEIINLNFNKTSLSKLSEEITFEKVIQDIIEFRMINLITRDNISRHLIILLEQAKKDHHSGDTKRLINKLEHFKEILVAERGEVIKKQAYQTLIKYLELLRH